MTALPAWLHRTVTGLAGVAVAISGAVAIAPAAASATGLSAPGTIAYILDDNIYLTTPDKSATVQVTTDGATATPDNTGDSPYSVPSESDGGLIVAIRNQEFNKGQASEYTQGIVWELDRAGHVIRKFRPAQFGYISGGGCSPAVLQLPLGIYNAVVSPNGRYIAYTAQTYVQSATCHPVQGYSSWIANIDGSGARMIADSSNNTASLEIGHFTADSSKLLVDRADFGSIGTYYVDVPGATAQLWTQPASGNFIDEAYQQADIRGGVMATDGYSDATNSIALRLWTFSDFAHQPTARCDWNSAVDPNSTEEYVGHQSLAPDGSAVAFVDTNGAADGANEGIYLLSTSSMNSGCSGTQALFIPHGTDPFWTPAGLYGPPTVSFTVRPAAVTNSRSATVQFAATTTDPARHVTGYTCRLDGGAPHACTSPATMTGLADGSHTLTVAASDGWQTGSASVTWRVDTAKPAAALTAPTAVATTASSVRVSWSGSDTGSGIARYQVRYQRAPFSGGFGAWSSPASWQQLTGRSLTAAHLAAGYDYCWSVRAVDRAGNAGSWSRARCTAVALDDRSAARSAGWLRKTGSAYYHRTITTTTRKGATLKRTHTVVDRVGVVATTCAKCGKVAIYVGRTRIGVIDLHATHTHQRVLKLLSRFALRSGTVTVKVLTSGRTVAIDGLVLSRS